MLWAHSGPSVVRIYSLFCMLLANTAFPKNAAVIQTGICVVLCVVQTSQGDLCCFREGITWLHPPPPFVAAVLVSEAGSDYCQESPSCAQDFLLKSVCYLLISAVLLFLLSCLGHYTVPVPYPQTLPPHRRPPTLQAHSDPGPTPPHFTLHKYAYEWILKTH